MNKKCEYCGADIAPTSIDPAVLKGTRWRFFGAVNNQFRLAPEGGGEPATYQVVEDPSDGYRSMFSELLVLPHSDEIFPDTPLATVVVLDGADADFEGWVLHDVDRHHNWLTFGTSNTNDYYPSFTFDYEPPKETS